MVEPPTIFGARRGRAGAALRRSRAAAARPVPRRCALRCQAFSSASQSTPVVVGEAAVLGGDHGPLEVVGNPLVRHPLLAPAQLALLRAHAARPRSAGRWWTAGRPWPPGRCEPGRRPAGPGPRRPAAPGDPAQQRLHVSSPAARNSASTWAEAGARRARAGRPRRPVPPACPARRAARRRGRRAQSMKPAPAGRTSGRRPARRAEHGAGTGTPPPLRLLAVALMTTSKAPSTASPARALPVPRRARARQRRMPLDQQRGLGCGVRLATTMRARPRLRSAAPARPRPRRRRRSAARRGRPDRTPALRRDVVDQADAVGVVARSTSSPSKRKVLQACASRGAGALPGGQRGRLELERHGDVAALAAFGAEGAHRLREAAGGDQALVVMQVLRR